MYEHAEGAIRQPLPRGVVDSCPLFLAVPQTISHEVTPSSPLRPTPVEASLRGRTSRNEGGSPARKIRHSARREAERERLLRERSRIAKHILETVVEVIVTLDATDPLTGSPFQARHSYTRDEIVFDARFEPAVFREEDGGARIDWECFHALEPVGFNETAEVEAGELRADDESAAETVTRRRLRRRSRKKELRRLRRLQRQPRRHRRRRQQQKRKRRRRAAAVRRRHGARRASRRRETARKRTACTLPRGGRRKEEEEEEEEEERRSRAH